MCLHHSVQTLEVNNSGQCCPRVAASPYRPNSPFTQLSPSMTSRLGSVNRLLEHWFGSSCSLSASLIIDFICALKALLLRRRYAPKSPWISDDRPLHYRWKTNPIRPSSSSLHKLRTAAAHSHEKTFKLTERKANTPSQLVSLGGFHIWRPQNFRIFWPPLPLVTCINQLILFVSSAFCGPPSPIHCGSHMWKPPYCSAIQIYRSNHLLNQHTSENSSNIIWWMWTL